MYLNDDELKLLKAYRENLTLTRVVFEFAAHRVYFIAATYLTLTRVVFECAYLYTPQVFKSNLTLTRVVFE